MRTALVLLIFMAWSLQVQNLFRAQFPQARVSSGHDFSRALSALFLKESPTCHSERSEESWLGLNPAEPNENIRNASHDSSCPPPRNDREALQDPELIGENPDSNHETRGSSNG